jgi:hypothetical protein
MNAEKGIVAADGSGIWERWKYGLRLLADPAAISNGNGGGLRHGVAEDLVVAARARGLKLSATEIRYRLQCARTYPHESQIAKAIGDFGTWFALIQARFPTYESDPDEPVADYRTKAERRHDAARHLLDIVGEQGTLFPLDRYEPKDTLMKDLQDYVDAQDEMTARFAELGRRRRDYLKRLLEAVDGDMTKTWAEAHEAAFGTTDVTDMGEE